MESLAHTFPLTCEEALETLPKRYKSLALAYQNNTAVPLIPIRGVGVGSQRQIELTEKYSNFSASEIELKIDTRIDAIEFKRSIPILNNDFDRYTKVELVRLLDDGYYLKYSDYPYYVVGSAVVPYAKIAGIKLPQANLIKEKRNLLIQKQVSIWYLAPMTHTLGLSLRKKYADEKNTRKHQ